ncbi:pilus assembly protein PilL [Enterobacter sp. CM29]|uniref:pilus assembly protein PilL n=1 Tax=Enterobacter sp. CM29 TaxID=2738449 RepID=UPI0015C5548F|nr:pilus assembly protein PilL [Enterobacter sp. CM29]NQD64131.1 pilus assembly protein PilL [Enterobacter sp. CM29]
MKTMSIKSAAIIVALALPLYTAAASNPFAGSSSTAGAKPYTVTEATTSAPRTAYGYDVNVSGPFTQGGAIPAGAKDPRYQFVDPLTVYMRTVWPEDVTTVRQAIDYLLEPTGYRLITRYPAPREASYMVDKPIPPIAKIHRTMPVLDALQLLVGLDNYVVVDHAHHLVSFQKNG